MDAQLINPQQGHDAIKISDECFLHLAKSMPERIKAALNAKQSQTI